MFGIGGVCCTRCRPAWTQLVSETRGKRQHAQVCETVHDINCIENQHVPRLHLDNSAGPTSLFTAKLLRARDGELMLPFISRVLLLAVDFFADPMFSVAAPAPAPLLQLTTFLTLGQIDEELACCTEGRQHYQARVFGVCVTSHAAFRVSVGDCGRAVRQSSVSTRG